MIKSDNPMRFGIMCNGTTLQLWQTRCLEYLLAMDNVQLVLIITEDDTHTIFDKIKKHGFNRSFFLIYWYFFVRPDSLRRVNMSNMFSGVPFLHCNTIKKGNNIQYIQDFNVNTIREYKLDFILHFGFGIIQGDILGAAKYGVWSYHHDDEELYMGTPACFWEIYNNDTVTGANLHRLTERHDGGIILKKGYFNTISFSYAKNVNAVFLESARWVSQVCIDILNGNANYLNLNPFQKNAPLYFAPNNLQMLVFISKIIKNFAFMIYTKQFCYVQWNIGIVYEPIHIFLEPNRKYNIHYLPCPEKGTFIADPFGIVKNNILTILYEDFDYRTDKGLISSIDIELDGKKTFSNPSIAIESPFHMSYPYLLEHCGEIYCIPETSQDKTITLYKAQEFPHRWIKASVLIRDIAGVDATIFQYGGLWWLTCVDKNMKSNLMVFYAPDLFGEWQPHSANPVKTDVHSARPAGTPFMHNGNLYRPAQDCSKTYGGRIVINQVTKLTPTEFKEEPKSFVEPFAEGHFQDGVHTISSVGNITLLDGKKTVFFEGTFLLKRIGFFFSRIKRKVFGTLAK